MKVSLSRAIAVTLGLVAVGSVCGAALGGIALLIDLRRFIPEVEMGGASGVFLSGAFFGAILGAALAPITGWTFLRRVSLGRAIGQTALGALGGILAGAILRPGRAVMFAWIGFAVAAIHLWFVTRHAVRHHDHAS